VLDLSSGKSQARDARKVGLTIFDNNLKFFQSLINPLFPSKRKRPEIKGFKSSRPGT
jgi:hypothetical protein